MTLAAHEVSMLRDMVAEWDRAHFAYDLDGTRTAGARLVGAVEALLRQHDAETSGGAR